MLIQQNVKSTMAVVIILLLTAIAQVSSADSSKNDLPDDRTLIAQLRKGGFNIYFRHEATDWSQSDRVSQVDDWLSCDGSRIRQLSESGRKSATATGAAIRSLGIPIGRVLASPYCRTVETARLMQLGEVEPTNDVINLRIAEYFGGQSAIVARARKLLSRSPASGSNNIIVAHGNVARNATPVYPDEGEGVIFRPDDKDGFVLVGRLKPEDWIRLAKDGVE